MAKYAAKGNAIFKWTISASLTTVAQVRSIDTDGSNQAIDVTDLDDSAREFVSGIYDGGEVTIELVYDPANAQVIQMRTDWKAGTIVAAQVTVAAATRAFSAIIIGLRESLAEGGAIMGTFTFKVTGAITDA